MEKSSNKTLNKNREIKIDKLILNISVGNQQVPLTIFYFLIILKALQSSNLL